MKTSGQGSTVWRALRSTCAIAAAFGILMSAGCSLYFGDGDDLTPNGEDDIFEPPPAFPSDFPPAPTCDELDSAGPFMDGFPLELGSTVQADTPPPAISGGTLAISPDDAIAIAADPDRDQIYVISLTTNSLVRTILLNAGDEPGRVAFDDAGTAYVALRRGGAIVEIDAAGAALTRRMPVCAAPRGLAIDPATDALYVACHGGELLTMDRTTGLVVESQRLENGLRDVVVDGEHRYVTVFRSSEVIVLNRRGDEIDRMAPPPFDTEVFDPFTGILSDARFEPAVAWRSVKRPTGGVVLAHQRARIGEVQIAPGGYGGEPCSGGVAHGAVTPLRSGAVAPVTSQLPGVLPVDLALINGGQKAAVVLPGSTINSFGLFPSVLLVPTDDEDEPGDDCFSNEFLDVWQGEPVAVAAASDDMIAIQLREPASLQIFAPGSSVPTAEISLSSESRADTGHALFHMTTFSGISCAGCHPEGADDGRVWDFACIGARRTQSLNFGLLGTEPFHWDGDMNTLDTLMTEVFMGRMGGGEPRLDQIDAMGQWMDTLRPPPRATPEDPAAVARGKAIFENSIVGCETCHSGAKFTNNQSFDVGTGGTFQVPTLIGIADRAPFIHTGCAGTLRERFTDPECGGGDRHGVVSVLTSQQIDDLVAYLETL